MEGETTLLAKKVDGRGERVLARDVDPGYGLAVTSGRVVFAETHQRTVLRELSLDGSKTLVLSRSLLAPFALRGNLLAWIERVHGMQRVVVRNLVTGRVRLALSLPRCAHGHCYLLEEVTLADRGVVFTRDSSNPDRSWVIRVTFADRHRTQVLVANDPQPDLKPSSAGALYYAFGEAGSAGTSDEDPSGSPFPANRPFRFSPTSTAVAFLRISHGCDSGLVVSDHGRRTVVASPRTLRRLVGAKSQRLCIYLEGFSLAGRTTLSAWAFVPPGLGEDAVKGVRGLGFVSSVPS